MIGRLFTYTEAQKLLPRRTADANKGDAGKVLIVAGSPGMAGAAILAAKGAYRAGAGLVKVAAPPEVIEALQVAVPEATTLTLTKMEINGNSLGCEETVTSDRILAEAKGFHSMVIGPGLGKAPTTKAMVEELIEKTEIPLVLDADALNLISENTDILHKSKAQMILTPHPAEMGRLIKKSTAEINSDREKTAQAFAKKYGVSLVLKGAGTVVAGPSGEVSINTTGNCGMATAGSGDVLAGIAGALAAIMPTENAARLAVYIHGLAGDMGIKEEGIFGLMATDIAAFTGKALRSICD